MKKILFYFLFFSLLFSSIGLAQEEPLPTSLPTVIIQGKDRSYMEIIRLPKLSHMGLRGGKSKEKLILEIVLLPRVRYALSFPSLIAKPVKVVPISKKKEILPYPIPEANLSQSYISYERVGISPEKEREVFLKQSTGEKELIQPPLEIELLKKGSYSSLSFPSSIAKPVKVVPISKKKEILPYPIPEANLSQSYISYERVGISPEKEREVFLKQSTGEKELIQPSEKVVFLPQRSFPLTFPKGEKKPLKIVSTPSKKEILPSAFEVAFSPNIIFQPSSPRKKIEPSKERPLFKLNERKGMIQPPLEIPQTEKIYYPEQIEKSPLPYLHLSSFIGSYGNFNYELNYGQELNITKYLLAMKRNSFPLWSIYEKAGSSRNLFKEDDEIRLAISWNPPGESGWELAAEGYQKKLEFSDKVRNQTKVFLQPSWELSRKENIFKLSGWVETVGGSEQPITGVTTTIKKWEDVTFGAQIEMQMRDSPLSLGITGDWESLKGDYNRQKNQICLWGKHRALFSGENIVVSLEAGIKEPAEFVPSLKIDYRFKPSWKLNLGIEKKFYLPRFSELYLDRDYVGINDKLDAINIWDYRLRLEYQSLPKMDISLEGFCSNGKGIVWDWDGDESKPENIKLNQQGWKLELTYRLTPSFKGELILISQETKNIDPEHPGWVITHSPENSGQLWLKWEEKGWAVAVGKEWIDKRYYDLDPPPKELPSGWKEKFKVSREKGNWKIFAELESANYCLWGLGEGKYYKLPQQKVSLGMEIKLF